MYIAKNVCLVLACYVFCPTQNGNEIKTPSETIEGYAD